jgi:hypothetical protein
VVKILVQVPQMLDIGRLDATLRLPMALRKQHGMRTVCDACGKPIQEDYFIGGFKKGSRNLLLHEACLPADEPQPQSAPMALEA